MPAIVVLYHRVGEPHHDWLLESIPVNQFQRQLSYIMNNFEVLPLETLVMLLRSGKAPPDKSAVLTFDDGYADSYLNAFPLLARNRVPATIFLSTGCIEGRRLFWWDRLSYAFWESTRHVPGPDRVRARDALLECVKVIRPWSTAMVESLIQGMGVHLPEHFGQELVLTWDQVREMSAAGIAFGGHTVDHAILTDMPAGEVRRQLNESRAALAGRAALAALALPGGSFFPLSYPNGNYDDEVIRLSGESGYDCGLTCEPVAVGPGTDPFRIGRVIPGADFEEFKTALDGLCERG